MFKLPKFVNIYICSYLTLKDLIFLQRTSKGWHNFSKLDDLWLFKLKIDYPHVNYNVYEDHFKLYKYLTLSVGYVFEVCGSRLDKPHHLLRGKILKQYLDFLPLSYTIDENSHLRFHGVDPTYTCIFVSYVRQFYTGDESQNPFLKNIASVITTEKLALILTTQNKLYTLSFGGCSSLPVDIALTPGTRTIGCNLIPQDVTEIGWHEPHFGQEYVWYLTRQNCFYVAENTATFIKIENVKSVSECGHHFYYVDLNNNIYETYSGNCRSSLYYQTNHQIKQLVVTNEREHSVETKCYILDMSNNVYLTSKNNSTKILTNCIKLCKDKKRGNVYGLQSNLDLISFSENNVVVAHNVVNMFSDRYGLKVLTL